MHRLRVLQPGGAGGVPQGPGGKATLIAPRQVWSPVDGGYLWDCPASAITARDPGAGRLNSSPIAWTSAITLCQL